MCRCGSPAAGSAIETSPAAHSGTAASLRHAARPGGRGAAHGSRRRCASAAAGRRVLVDGRAAGGGAGRDGTCPSCALRAAAWRGRGSRSWRRTASGSPPARHAAAWHHDTWHARTHAQQAAPSEPRTKRGSATAPAPTPSQAVVLFCVVSPHNTTLTPGSVRATEAGQGAVSRALPLAVCEQAAERLVSDGLRGGASIAIAIEIAMQDKDLHTAHKLTNANRTHVSPLVLTSSYKLPR